MAPKTAELSTRIRNTEKAVKRLVADEQAHLRHSQEDTSGDPEEQFVEDHRPDAGSDDEDEENPSAAPAKLISKENSRQPYLKTILNPEQESPAATSYRPPATPANSRMSAFSWSSPPPAPEQPAIRDPVSAGIIDEGYAKVLFDLVFLRLNPFICLFDPALHSVNYVRSRSPFLFTVILMAGCKFFKPEAFRQCQKMANELATRAFAENWKSVEVVQAFACLCYWKEPEDTVIDFPTKV